MGLVECLGEEVKLGSEVGGARWMGVALVAEVRSGVVAFF